MEKIKKNYLGQGIQERTKKNLRKTAFKNLPSKNFTFPFLNTLTYYKTWKNFDPNETWNNFVQAQITDHIKIWCKDPDQ